MITLENIVKSYPMGSRELVILHGINLHVKKGEMVAIMGPSGSGKSTMLNILGLLDTPTSGNYYLDGKEVSKLTGVELSKTRGRKIGFIFQTFNLLSYMSAQKNVELGLKYGGKDDYELASQALAIVGLAERAKHKPLELSGGERQRVAIARALVKDPPILLADEPTGNLDSRSGEEVMKILMSLHRERGITLLIITHDRKVAEHCQRIIHIMDGMIEREEINEKMAS